MYKLNSTKKKKEKKYINIKACEVLHRKSEQQHYLLTSSEATGTQSSLSPPMDALVPAPAAHSTRPEEKASPRLKI